MWYCTYCGIVINTKKSKPNKPSQQQKILLKNTDNSHESNFPISDHEVNVFDKDSTAKNY